MTSLCNQSTQRLVSDEVLSRVLVLALSLSLYRLSSVFYSGVDLVHYKDSERNRNFRSATQLHHDHFSMKYSITNMYEINDK